MKKKIIDNVEVVDAVTLPKELPTKFVVSTEAAKDLNDFLMSCNNAISTNIIDFRSAYTILARLVSTSIVAEK